jgi:hypothetical protein
MTDARKAWAAAHDRRDVRDLVEAYLARGGEVHRYPRNARTVDEWEWPRVRASGKLPERASR